MIRYATVLFTTVIVAVAITSTASAALPTAPFNQCPAVADDTSCAVLIYVDPNGATGVLGDPTQGPYDDDDDTMVGVQNDSPNPIQSFPLSSTTDIFGFDGDGLCDDDPSTAPAGCPFGPTGYEGPGVSFNPGDDYNGTVTFTPAIPPGGHAYFSLEEALATVPPFDVTPGPATVSSCDTSLMIVGCWRFGEPPATTLAFDASGNNNNGVYLGGVTLGQPGVFAGDTAASFDGFNDTVRIPSSVSLNVGDHFSAEAWVKRSSTAKSLELMNKGANGLQLMVMNAGSGNQVWLRKAGVNTLAHSVGGIAADGKYHHVVATMSGPGTEKIYIDGVLDTALVTAPQTIQNTTFPLTFGAAGSSQAFYDDFALFGRPLTAAEIQARFARGTP